MAQNKSSMPQSGAGLIRYFDESSDAIKLKPEHVVILCVAVIALELVLKAVL